MADSIYILNKGGVVTPYGNLLSLVRDMQLEKQYSTIRRAMIRSGEAVEFTCTDKNGDPVTFEVTRKKVKRSTKNQKKVIQ
jgi:hypothetical protein